MSFGKSEPIRFRSNRTKTQCWTLVGDEVVVDVSQKAA